MGDQFGGCPECGEHDGYRNVYKHHFFFCVCHLTVWEPGYNLFSSWRDETEADWEDNYTELSEYRYVDLGSGKIGPPLVEIYSYEDLVPPE